MTLSTSASGTASPAPRSTIPQRGSSREAGDLQNKLVQLSVSKLQGVSRTAEESTEERLFESRAQFKVLTSQIAMHLDDAWREKLFHQVDSLLDADEWQKEDVEPSAASARTFLRLILALRPEQRPGLGASHGHLIAAWTNGKNQLTIECLPKDRLRFSLVTYPNPNEEPERAAGTNVISRLADVLAPYHPSQWLKIAHSIRAG